MDENGFRSLPVVLVFPRPPDVIFPSEFKISRSLNKAIRENRFEIKVDHDFRSTIQSCASVKRASGESTWIESDMIEDYVRLHEQGIAHSVEAYQDGKLKGGLYGLSMGGLFFGESIVPEASKACLAKLVEIATRQEFDFIDCQESTLIWKALVPEKSSVHAFLTRLKAGLAVDKQPL